MRQLPYDGANQQVQKVRLSPSQPLITAPLLANTVCTSFSHLSSTFFSDIMQLYNANIRSKGDDDRWTEPFCTATATRFSRVWKRCSTRRLPTGPTGRLRRSGEPPRHHSRQEREGQSLRRTDRRDHLAGETEMPGFTAGSTASERICEVFAQMQRAVPAVHRSCRSVRH